MAQLRVTAVQTQGVVGDVSANITLAVRWAKEAAAEGSHLLILPELFTSGYFLSVDEVQRLAVTLDGDVVKDFCDAARANKIAIITGILEKGSDGKCYNSAIAIDENGRLLGHYRKTHLYSDHERERFARPAAEDPAAQYKVFSMCGVRMGLLVCYDIEFPEPARILALEGVEFIVVPTANFWTGIPDILVRARAVENLCVVAYVNRCGTERGLQFGGHTVVWGSHGEAFLSTDGNDETVLRGCVDFGNERMRQLRDFNPYFADRQPAYYGRLCKGNGDGACT